MFDTVLGSDPAEGRVSEDEFDVLDMLELDALLGPPGNIDPEPQRPRQEWSQEWPWAALTPGPDTAAALDTHTADPASLTDTGLVEAIIGFERLTGWAQARQARLLAEFATRRPGDDPTLVATDKPCTIGRFAPDEIGLALHLSRITAKARLGRAVQLNEVLPETLEVWEQGRLDERRVTAICDATHYLPTAKARAVQHQVLDRAPGQTQARLKATLKRAVLKADPDGAHDRHRAARRDRRVAVGEEQEGMASLWALLSATDARSCFHWLTRLAQGCGSTDPRGMDARRADLMVNLLTGTLTHTPYTATRAATDASTDANSDSAPSSDTRSGSGCDAGSDLDAGSNSGADADLGTDTGTDTGPGPGAGSGSDIAPDSGTAPGSDTDADGCTGGGADAGATAGPDSSATGSSARDGSAPDSSGTDSSGTGQGNARLPQPVNPGKPLVQVLMPFTTLLGLDQQACELAGHGPIPAELAREIAADATLKRLVYDPLSGALLDHGRTTYRPPAALADHVRARDVHCRGPICGRRAIDSELDHVIPYPTGPTSVDNLMSGCGHDHHAKHASGWHVRARPDGRIEWTTPTGHRYYSDPYDYRIHDKPAPEPAATRATATRPPPHRAAEKSTAQLLDEITTQTRDGRHATAAEHDDPPPF